MTFDSNLRILLQDFERLQFCYALSNYNSKRAKSYTIKEMSPTAPYAVFMFIRYFPHLYSQHHAVSITCSTGMLNRMTD